ncbi:MAG: sulfide/dihydroorotate dehydrogenase-like FAD/NAD-binding protein [Coriobacteriia bacterium]|nr:sulfide/dihydroorotate dehydrogenase-like FAD/NAD-binding protein [Coriobacteriia bacterium]
MFTQTTDVRSRTPQGNKILAKRQLAEGIIEMTVFEPRIAAKCQAGQFFMLRACPRGERVPFTFSDWSRDEGWFRFIFMVVGKTTALLSQLQVGERLQDLAGPLGRPTLGDRHTDSSRPTLGGDRHIDSSRPTATPFGKNIVVVGGGVGTAVAYPVARALCQAECSVRVIVGARTADLLILLDELRALPLQELIITTDDGSAGRTGLVTAPLEELCCADASSKAADGWRADHALIVGPAIMMKFAAATALQAGVPATVSLNPLMVDGTGMCGACRVSIDGQTKFACVDGPDFPAAGVDWEELMSRQRSYLDDERLSYSMWQQEQQRLHDNCDCFDVQDKAQDKVQDGEEVVLHD